jgi:hypothetical protein
MTKKALKRIADNQSEANVPSAERERLTRTAFLATAAVKVDVTTNLKDDLESVGEAFDCTEEVVRPPMLGQQPRFTTMVIGGSEKSTPEGDEMVRQIKILIAAGLDKRRVGSNPTECTTPGQTYAVDTPKLQPPDHPPPSVRRRQRCTAVLVFILCLPSAYYYWLRSSFLGNPHSGVSLSPISLAPMPQLD